MKKEKEISIKPYFDCEEQTNIGLNQDSWVIIQASTNNATEVFYFNPKANPDEFETFADFVESYKENDFYLEDSDGIEQTESKNKNYISLSSTSSSVDQDYDEDSGKSWEVIVGTALIADIYNGGITKDMLPEKIKQLEKSADDLASEAADAQADAESYRKDPYAYYGVRRSDFY